MEQLTAYDQIKAIQEHMTCSICLEHLCNPVQLENYFVVTANGKTKCTHKFCLICIRDYFGLNNKHKYYHNFKCPICRAITHGNASYYHQTSDHAILDILQNGKELQCPRKCDFMWTSQSSIKNHLLFDCPNSFGSCKLCSTLTPKGELSLHTKRCEYEQDKYMFETIRNIEIQKISQNPKLAAKRRKHLQQITSTKLKNDSINFWKQCVKKTNI